MKRSFGKDGYPLRQEIRNALSERLKAVKLKQEPLDVITFAGNGEPTLHPEFAGIIDDTIVLRNEYFPGVDIAVLSNSTMIHKEEIRKALLRVEQNILKLDSAMESTFILLNQPQKDFSFFKMMDDLKLLKGNFVLQTMFVKGSFKGKAFDNTTELELNAWLDVVEQLSPKRVMIYTIARDTPAEDIQKISKERLKQIAGLVENIGIPVQISA